MVTKGVHLDHFFLFFFCSSSFFVGGGNPAEAIPGERHLRMSGGKGRAKQPRDTDEDAVLQLLQALHHTHREATRLFLIAVREGATDAQIAHALRQGLPHLANPASLQDSRAGKQPERTGTSEKGKQPAAHKKRTLITSQAPTTQPALLTAALESMPAEDWSRTWAAGRTIMLRRTSKRVKEVVDKMRLPAVVRLSRSFWDDTHNGTEKQKRQFVLRQLAAMTARSHHHTRTAQLCNYRTTLQVCMCGVACRRSAGAVPISGAP
jgi:hypothetical protein